MHVKEYKSALRTENPVPRSVWRGKMNTNNVINANCKWRVERSFTAVANRNNSGSWLSYVIRVEWDIQDETTTYLQVVCVSSGQLNSSGVLECAVYVHTYILYPVSLSTWHGTKFVLMNPERSVEDNPQGSGVREDYLDMQEKK